MKETLKNRCCFLTALGVLLLCFACSNSSGVSNEENSGFSDSFDVEGFVKMVSHGKSVTLGTSSKDAPLNERPQMKVSFDYDFYIGRHEVTCGEFNRLMDKYDSKLKVSCAANSLPAADVTFYDAVLYANDLSLENGFDTVYVYSSLEMDDEGHCIGMQGFDFNPKVSGFRLPTEAEWMYVAYLNWHPYESWNADSSDFKAHEVCSRFGGDVCDMAGNVMEWVNDWMGYFREATVANYVGSPNGGSKGERVVKGGSFNDRAVSITLYGRGSTYTMTGEKHDDYLGFRLAFGAIENPVWLDGDGSEVSSKVSVVSGADKIRAQLGSKNAKLAFRNDATGNLVFVNFNQPSPYPVEIKDTLDAFHPDISPDGNWVAFSTGMEGLKNKSAVYVRHLDSAGTGLVKLNVESAAIPRWKILANGDTVIVYVSGAGDNKDESYFKSQSTWLVPFVNGKFGKPEKMFTGAYHGGVSESGRLLAVTGASRLHALSKKTSGMSDSVWFGGKQACNVSLANDDSKRVLFLDFNGQIGKTLVGKTYATHERLLIADSSGKLIQTVAAPKGSVFDHSEWVLNKADFVVASLEKNDAHRNIALVNLTDSSITELVEGDELWHPCLWTKYIPSVDSSKWDADSVGRYASASNQANYLLSHKMPMFWTLKDSVELVGLGNSHMWAGFDPFVMNVPSMNMGVYPCDMNCIDYLFENYVLNHLSKIKYVVVGLDFDLWYNPDENADINICMGSAPGFAYDVKHEFYKNGVDMQFLNLVAENAVEESESIIQNLGWNAADINLGWTDLNGISEIIGDSTWSNCLRNEKLQTCLLDSGNVCHTDECACKLDVYMDSCVTDLKMEGCEIVAEIGRDTTWTECLRSVSYQTCLRNAGLNSYFAELDTVCKLDDYVNTCLVVSELDRCRELYEVVKKTSWSKCLQNENLKKCLLDKKTKLSLGHTEMDYCRYDSNLSECLESSDLNTCKGIFSADIDKLKHLIKMARARNIMVVGVIFPISPYYKETGSYGRHGMQRSHAKLIIEEIKKIADSESNFVLMDENKFGEHDYPSTMALDCDHLNARGAKRLSSRLNALVKTLK